ncbi:MULTISPECIES: hypothetical protein [Sphingomonadaceae]|uniref:hypothetical protein n=1 Tax=Sphingomonadales TaxID=204457 RepID=UPI00119D1E99|nr:MULTISPECIES: hypothetical protein [Sphingomonadaceae]
MNQAEQALKTLLEPMLREEGFKSQPQLGFKRRTSFGFHYLSFPSFAMGKGGPYVINVGLGVRHNQVDEIVNRLGHIWGEVNKKNTTTLYRGLGYFPFDEARDNEKVISPDQMEAGTRSVASCVSEMLLTDGFKFFRHYSDIYECSVGLNAPIEGHTHPLCNNFPLRGYYGVAAAALAQPERVPSLIQSYTDYARRDGVVDNGVYEVGKELSGVDAIASRLEFVAEAAFASAS